MTTERRKARRLSARFMTAACLWLAGAMPWQWPEVRADPLEGALEVQSAFVSVVGGVYELNVRTRYPSSQNAAGVLRDGVSLSYDVDVEVSRERRFWINENIVSLQLKRELSYHSVSERYVVRDPLLEGEQKSYATLGEALVAIGSIERWPILVASQVTEPGNYLVSVRAGVRRGRLTNALRVLMFWSDDWQRESDWYSWSLPR